MKSVTRTALESEICVRGLVDKQITEIGLATLRSQGLEEKLCDRADY